MDTSTATVVASAAPSYLALAHQYLPPNIWNKIVVAMGYAALALQVAPWITAVVAPAAIQLADYLVGVAMASPFRPLFVWKAPQIIAFLKALQKALDDLIDAFMTEIEADLAKAAGSAPAEVKTQ
jgi:hypothetical protein